ncbi:MAG: hypothetical protein JWR38_1583 [Mucilaginibacter sp.]|nr:hypothetical protein [Mucilaginibacter sp.]
MRKMKIESIVIYWILSVLIVFGISSCKKNNDAGGNGTPTITRVRTVYQNITDSNVVHRITLDSSIVYSEASIAKFDSTITNGKIGTLYAIIGTNLATTSSVYFNGVSAYFNPAFLTNTSILVSIPSNVPYSNSSTPNVLTVTTQHGKVNFNFIIEQPTPIITKVDQLAGNPGDIITIAGTTFNGLQSVSFGTIPGKIITNTPTTISVQVPAGVTAAPILVTTAATKGGGTGTGPSLSAGKSILSNNVTATNVANGIFGFSTAIFEDQLENSWYDYGWSNTPVVDQTLFKRGTSSIKISYSGGFDGFGLGVGNGVPVSSTAALKMSLYGGKGTNGKLIQVTLNGTDNNHAVQLTLVEGAWTDFIIPIANFGDSVKPAPTSISGIVIQEYSGNATVFNIDDLGIVDVKK